MKIGQMITSIILVILGAVTAYACWDVVMPMTNQGLELLVTMPVAIIFLIVSTLISLGAIVSAVCTISSEILAIKIIGIVLLILSLAMFGFHTYLFVFIFNLSKSTT